MERPTWYSIKNLADESADVFVYDEIGAFGITAGAFIKDLQGITAGKLNLHINSPGGDVFDGLAIYSALKEHAAEVTVYVDALAASIATVIAMAGDRVIMARHSSMMIHDAFGMAVGTSEDMTKMAERLDVVSDQIASVYQERVAGSKTSTWRNRMKAETWYTDEQAVAAGLADEVGKPSGIRNTFDLSKFKHPPVVEPEPESEEQEEADAEPPVEFDKAEAFRQAASLTLMEVLT